MNDQQYLWLPLEDASSTNFVEDAFSSCYLAKVFCYYEGRNAWQWTWSSKYHGYKAFHPSFEAIRQRVEESRVQGSTWGIRELPALVFAGNNCALVVTEINTTAPLSFFSQGFSIESRKILDVSTQFNLSQQNSVIIFIANTPNVPPASLPFKNHTSISMGGSCQLYWEDKITNVCLEHILNIISRVTQILQMENV